MPDNGNGCTLRKRSVSPLSPADTGVNVWFLLTLKVRMRHRRRTAISHLTPALHARKSSLSYMLDKKEFFHTVCDNGWNMDPSLYTRDKSAVNWVDNKGWKPSAGKVLAFVFWDAHGILFIDYLERGRTIKSEYYMALLVRLKEEIAKKTTPNEEENSTLSLRQCTKSQVDHNCMNCTLNCLPIHRILRVWPPATTICSQT